jgi:hypothetical protein
MDDSETKNINPKDLRSEESAEELVQSAKMRPYLHVAEAMLTGKGLKKAVAQVAELPLEDRYIWRVLSALKWAFADLETMNVGVDRRTLTPDDRQRVIELLKQRPIQFCLFLRALIGADGMERMMMHAISVAKQVPGA